MVTYLIVALFLFAPYVALFLEKALGYESFTGSLFGFIHKFLYAESKVARLDNLWRGLLSLMCTILIVFWTALTINVYVLALELGEHGSFVILTPTLVMCIVACLDTLYCWGKSLRRGLSS